MKEKQSLAAWCIVLLALMTAARADVPKAATLDNRDRLVIDGANAFSPEEIREALFNDFDVVAAFGRNGPLRELTAVLVQRTSEGYLAEGFPEAKISVVAVGDKLQMTIDEGARYLAGEVDVTGNHLLDGDELKKQLTSPKAAGSERRPLWTADKAAPLDPKYRTRLTERCEEWIAEQGCYRPELEVVTEPDRDTKKVSLRIEISDEGPRSTVADVKISGNRKNSREAVKAYLDLDAQAPLTRDLREQIERRLLRSGRFIRARWELGKRAERGDDWAPRLVVKEYRLAPSLDESVGREEAALLKLAEWVERFEQSDDEVLVRSGGDEFALVFAPRRGFIVMRKDDAEHRAEGDEPGFAHALVFDEERVGLYSSAQRRKIVAVPPPSPMTGQAVFTLVGDAPDWDSQGSFKMSAGLSTKTQKGYRRHIQVQIEFSAAAALSVVRKHQAKFHWDGDVARVEWDTCQLRFNSSSGQLIELVVKTKDSPEGGAGSDFLHFVVTPGEFERRLAEIEASSADWPNLADAQRPLSCLGEFLCREMEQVFASLALEVDDMDNPFSANEPETTELMAKIWRDMQENARRRYAAERRGYAALAKVITSGLIEPFDKLALKACEPRKERFSIPIPHFCLQAGSLGEFQTLMRELAPRLGIKFGNELLRRDGWVNAAWQHGILALAGRRGSLPGGEWSGLEEELEKQPGPIRSLAEAEALHAAGAGYESTRYAMNGLDRLSLADYRNDYREIIEGNGFLNECFLKFAGTMRQLDADDIDALAELLELSALDEAQATAFHLAALRAHVEESPSQGAAKALDGLWRAGLSEWVKRRLDALAPEPPRAGHAEHGFDEDNPVAF